MSFSYKISVSAGTGCYRHLRISSDATLAELSSAILKFFEIPDTGSLHAFFISNKCWDKRLSFISRFKPGFKVNPLRFTDEAALCASALLRGTKFKYIYGLADELVFQCSILQYIQEDTPYPMLLKSVGSYPPVVPLPDTSFDNEDGGHRLTYKQDIMCSSTGLPLTIIQNICAHLQATANFYFAIPVKKAYEIYNAQNISVAPETFSRILSALVMDSRNGFALLYDKDSADPMEADLLDILTILTSRDLYEEICEKQEELELYIPPKKELMKYCEPTYFAPNKYYKALRSFLTDVMGISETASEDVAGLLCLLARRINDADALIDLAEKSGLHIKNSAIAERLAELLEDVIYNTRQPLLCGNLPREFLDGECFKPAQRAKKPQPQNLFKPGLAVPPAAQLNDNIIDFGEFLNNMKH